MDGALDGAFEGRFLQMAGPERRDGVVKVAGVQMGSAGDLDATVARGVALAEVAADRGRALLAARVLGGTALDAGRYTEIALEFTVDRPAVLEFRVEHRAGPGLWVDRVAVGPARGPS